MKFKRIVAATLCVLLAAASVGCSKNAETANTGETPTILWYTLGSQQADLQMVLDEANKLIEPKIGAKLNMVILDEGAYDQRMKMMMAAGDDYDICFSGYANKYVDGVKHGGFLKLNELLDTEATKLKEALPDYAWDAVSIDGKDIYAVPNIQCYSLPRCIHFQKDLVEKYNFDISSVKSINDIEPFLESVKQNDPDLYPFRTWIALSCWLNPKYENIYNIFYIDKEDEKCTVKVHYELPEFWDAQTKLHEWYNKGYIRSDVASAGGDSGDTVDYAAGRYACTPGSLYPGIAESMKTLTSKEVVSAQIEAPYLSGLNATQTLSAINVNSKNPVKSIKFLELMSTDLEIYNLICKGIEGKHYTTLEDGSIRLIDNSGYAPKADWKFGNQFNALRLEGSAPDIWDETRELDLSAQPSRLLGFNVNTDDISGELAQISSVQKAYNTTSGTMNMLEKKDEYIGKLKDAGTEKVKEILQAQIDEFLKNSK